MRPPPRTLATRGGAFSAHGATNSSPLALLLLLAAVATRRCRRESAERRGEKAALIDAPSGRTLTYLKSSETVTIDGNEQTRTQTKGSAQCP